jgi:tetratricopeptide (TPR) repeat protein
MPRTVNGVGTHYYGRSNVATREDACRFCRRQVRLVSYDTQLFFVVLFIPLIPLGRKRIVEQCPFCTRHFAVDADQWDTARQLDISGALERFDSNPTPETGLTAHAQMLSYHDFQQASLFRGQMLLRFGDSAQLQAGIGAALEQIGKIPESVVHFRRALELRPDLPAAKAAIALQHIRDGKLEEARPLLDHLEQPGAGSLYPLAPLELLGNAYQARGRHQEALDVYAKVLAEIPSATEHKGFRKKVEASERAVRAVTTILPPQPRSFRQSLAAFRQGSRGIYGALVFVAVAAVVITIGLMLTNEYTRRHRRLYVVNAYPQPARVEVPGVGSITVGRTPAELPLPEGRYRAIIHGPIEEEVNFEVRAESYAARWIEKPVCVLNVGGAALLSSEIAHYSRSNIIPPDVTYHFGESFFAIGDISNQFKPLPQQVNLSSSEREKILTHLDVFRGKPMEAFQQMLLHKQDAEALRFAEWRLRSFPPALEFVDAYGAKAMEMGQIRRAEETLHAGLSRRPVEIAWHRLYQSLDLSSQREAALRREYDAALAREPGNSALLYLRGRLCGHARESRQYFDRAREADPQNPWPLFAIAYQLADAGDWKGSRPLYARALELDPRNPSIDQELFLTRLALGETLDLAHELREAVKKSPQDAGALLRLCDVLAADGLNSELKRFLADYQRATRRFTDPASVVFIKSVLARGYYSIGDFALMEQTVAGERDPSLRLLLGQALIEQGRIAEASKNGLLPPQNGEPSQLVACAIAWSLARDPVSTSGWLNYAKNAFLKGDANRRRAAALLDQPLPPTLDEVEAADLYHTDKAAVLAALGVVFRNERKDYAERARRFNVDRDFPYHLLRRTINPAPTRRPSIPTP